MDTNPKSKEMKKIIVPLLLLAMLFTQCVPSLHPLYTKKDLVLDDRILGQWQEEEGSDTWRFYQTDETSNHYLLEMTQEDGKKFLFESHLIKLGEEYYLDFFPGEDENPTIKNTDKNTVQVVSDFPQEFHSMHWWPMHTFAKINVNDDSLNIQLFDPEWIEDLIKQSKIRIKHEKVAETYILTASTEELQKFVLKYGQDKRAFSEETILERKL